MKPLHRHITMYIESEEATIHRCGEPVLFGLKVNGAYEKPFEMEPTTGEHDYTTCKGCQSQLKQLTEHLAKVMAGDKQPPFPLCCEGHRKLLKYKEFDLSHFVDANVTTAHKVIYTNQHIINYIGKDDWYKEITHYLDYGFESFGKFPNDTGNPYFLDAYLYYIKSGLSRQKEFSKERVSKILEFIDAFQHPKKRLVDLNILEEIYQQWLKEFPFGLLSYFGHVKDIFERQIPLCQGELEYNKYLGMSVGLSHNKESLFDYLIATTNTLLTAINGTTLYEKGLVQEIDKLQIDLINQSRKQKVREGYNNTSPDVNHRYRKMIKEWLEDEKQYWAELRPLIGPVKETNEQLPAEIRGISNNFDRVPIEDVYNHFRKGLVGKKHLLENDLVEFLSLAFDKQILPKQRFRLTNITSKQKQAIYPFYSYYKDVAGKPHGKQPAYAALLGNYFEGYETANVVTNFGKGAY